MGFSDYQQVTSIKCPIRIVGADAECPIRIVFCPISIVPLPNFTRIFAADSATCGKARRQPPLRPIAKGNFAADSATCGKARRQPPLRPLAKGNFAAGMATRGKARRQASFAPDCKSVGGIKNMMPYEQDRKKDTA